MVEDNREQRKWIAEPMKVESIQKTSTPELVVREILKNIKSGELKPGDKLPPERELSRAFGVGRSSIREAISAMVLVGYFEATQGKGVFLREDIPLPHVFNSKLSDVLAAYWILDLIETREHLECSVVRMAAAKAEDADIEKLREAAAAIRSNGADIDRFYESDFEFHMTLAEAAENPVMSGILKMIVEKLHADYMAFMPDTLCRPDRAIETAARIVDRIAAKDPEGACAVMLEHLGIVKTELVRIIPEIQRHQNRKDMVLMEP